MADLASLDRRDGPHSWLRYMKYYPTLNKWVPQFGHSDRLIVWSKLRQQDMSICWCKRRTLFRRKVNLLRLWRPVGMIK